MRYAFIESHRPMWRLERMCRVLSVSKAGYFAWRHRQGRPSARTAEDRAVSARIRVIHADSRTTYGSPRIHRALRTQGVHLGRKRVERLMRDADIRARPRRRKFTVTTDSMHGFPVAENLLAQDFTAPAPNRRWVADITYVETAEGWLYVASILDLFSRRVVGWSMQDRQDTDLVLGALRMAVAQRQPAPGLIHHSDRGSQYASTAYRQALDDHGFIPSMSRSGCCYDNAAAESLWNTLKVELIHKCAFQTRNQARQAIFEYLEGFYNRVRIHSTINYMSPDEFEQQHVAVV